MSSLGVLVAAGAAYRFGLRVDASHGIAGVASAEFCLGPGPMLVLLSTCNQATAGYVELSRLSTLHSLRPLDTTLTLCLPRFARGCRACAAGTAAETVQIVFS